MIMRCIYRLSLLGLALTQAEVSASTVLQMDLADLSRRASRIFVARCEARGFVAIEGRPHTRVEFQILETVKGNGGEREAVLFAGGELDGVRQWLAGMPTFEPGEEVVLFLTAPDTRGRSWPIGLAQGKFRVFRDASNRPIVVQGKPDLNRAPPPAAARPVGSAPGGQPLGLFLDRIRKLIGSEQGDGDAR